MLALDFRRLTVCCALSLAVLVACASGKEGAESGAPANATPSSTATSTAGGNTTSPAQAAAGNTTTPVKAVPWPNIGFVNNPGGNDPKAVALTFDDGPDGGTVANSNTSKLLDLLKAQNVKATFFVCGSLWSDVANDPVAQNNVKRMLAEGHHVGSHTQHHITFNQNAIPQYPAELTNNASIFQTVLGPSWPGFSMYRAPYGIPFQDNPVADVAAMGPRTAEAGVHVGWGIDSEDWNCLLPSQGAGCVMSSINRYLAKGASGPILMHAINSLTIQVLPQILASISQYGYHIVMVEDFIQAKYGGSSAQVAAAQRAANYDPNTLSTAAVAALQQSKWYLGTNE